MASLGLTHSLAISTHCCGTIFNASVVLSLLCHLSFLFLVLQAVVCCCLDTDQIKKKLLLIFIITRRFKFNFYYAGLVISTFFIVMYVIYFVSTFRWEVKEKED